VRYNIAAWIGHQETGVIITIRPDGLNILPGIVGECERYPEWAARVYNGVDRARRREAFRQSIIALIHRKGLRLRGLPRYSSYRYCVLSQGTRGGIAARI
jgi:hypothetical protein